MSMKYIQCRPPDITYNHLTSDCKAIMLLLSLFSDIVIFGSLFGSGNSSRWSQFSAIQNICNSKFSNRKSMLIGTKVFSDSWRRLDAHENHVRFYALVKYLRTLCQTVDILITRKSSFLQKKQNKFEKYKRNECSAINGRLKTINETKRQWPDRVTIAIFAHTHTHISTHDWQR